MPLTTVIQQLKREDGLSKAALSLIEYLDRGATHIFRDSREAILHFALDKDKARYNQFYANHQQRILKSDGAVIRLVSNSYAQKDDGTPIHPGRHADEHMLQQLILLIATINKGGAVSSARSVDRVIDFDVPSLNASQLAGFNLNEVAKFAFLQYFREGLNIADAWHVELLKSLDKMTGAEAASAQTNLVIYFPMLIAIYLETFKSFRDPKALQLLQQNDPDLFLTLASTLTAFAYELDLWFEFFTIAINEGRLDQIGEDNLRNIRNWCTQYRQQFSSTFKKENPVLPLQTLESYAQLLGNIHEMKHPELNTAVSYPKLQKNMSLHLQSYAGFIKNNWGKILIGGLIITALAAGFITLCVLMPPLVLSLPVIGKILTIASPFVIKAISFLGSWLGSTLLAQAGGYAIGASAVIVAAEITSAIVANLGYAAKKAYQSLFNIIPILKGVEPRKAPVILASQADETEELAAAPVAEATREDIHEEISISRVVVQSETLSPASPASTVDVTSGQSNNTGLSFIMKWWQGRGEPQKMPILQDDKERLVPSSKSEMNKSK